MRPVNPGMRCGMLAGFLLACALLGVVTGATQHWWIPIVSGSAALGIVVLLERAARRQRLALHESWGILVDLDWVREHGERFPYATWYSSRSLGRELWLLAASDEERQANRKARYQRERAEAEARGLRPLPGPMGAPPDQAPIWDCDAVRVTPADERAVAQLREEEQGEIPAWCSMV